ncbi:MAG: 16S rRNA (uracil(1498)-N(3))-methyltransferase [Clostridiales bacterium]|jgi:16S rRNA (uracil1498-N3)-methyltransferase|nr:16S rRNA (uracil(1498)-N(3))-methyltransferase [Clostridiales bacterium]
MPHYFFDRNAITGKEVTLSGDTARHLLTVLRVTAGDEITLCDGQNRSYHCAVTKPLRKENILTASIRDIRDCKTEPPVRVTLYQALPKSEKLDVVVQKCVELGIHAIQPVITARTVARPSNESAKWQRLQKISKSAAEQSMRGIIPRVYEPVTFEAALSAVGSGDGKFHLIAYENECKVSLYEALKGKPATDAGIWVGPEGGFADYEISALRGKGAVTFTLGSRILRTETAGMAALTRVLFLWEG